MAIKVVLAKSHESQLSDPDIKKEFDSISESFNNVELNYKEGTVNFVFIKGIYNHTERKMITACLFVNNMQESIKELYGELRLKFASGNASIAKSIINFDEEFMGELKVNEALLVHIGIPVKGLISDSVFLFNDISGNFENVRITNI